MPRPRLPPRASLSWAIAAALLLATGCADTSHEVSPPPGGAAAWSTSTDPVEAGGLVWATGSIVHLADGTTVDAGGPMTAYVVAGDGVYFTPADSDEDGTLHSNMTTGPLHFADRDGGVTDTGLTVYVESLGSSPDGRYLGLIDATSGRKDSFSDQPQATAVVLDLASGQRVVGTTDGMGDPRKDDLAHDYPEVNLSVRFPDAESAYVEGLDDIRYALPGGQGESADAIDSGVRSPTDPTSPGGDWTIEDRGLHDRVVSSSGDTVPLRTRSSRWDLRSWLDASTLVGIAVTEPGAGTTISPDDTATLITCRVPDGACSAIEGTAGKVLHFPVGSADESLTLPGDESAG